MNLCADKFSIRSQKWATGQDSMNRGAVASWGRRIYRRDGLPRVFWRGQGGGGSLEQINGQTVPRTKTGMGRRVQKTVAPGLCYLTSLSSYLTTLPLNTVNSNMFLTSNTNTLSSNTQAMKSLVFVVSGRGRYVEVHQVDPQHGGFSWEDVTTLTADPRYPRQFAAGGLPV